MNHTIKAVIVDDSAPDANSLKELLNDSNFVRVTRVFNHPREFMEKVPGLDMDLCLLDIIMPGMDGFTVAQLLPDTPIIFVTGMDHKLRGAIELNPIDIVPKPIKKERLDQAVEKAYKLLHNVKEYAIFNVAEYSKKVKIYLPDIVLVKTDEVDARHKNILLKNGTAYTIMDCSLESLLELSQSLVKVNRAEAVSLDAVNQVDHDLITVNYSNNGKTELKEVTLSRSCKESFHKNLFYKGAKV